MKSVVMSLTDRRARRLWRFALFVEAFLVFMSTNLSDMSHFGNDG